MCQTYRVVQSFIKHGCMNGGLACFSDSLRNMNARKRAPKGSASDGKSIREAPRRVPPQDTEAQGWVVNSKTACTRQFKQKAIPAIMNWLLQTNQTKHVSINCHVTQMMNVPSMQANPADAKREALNRSFNLSVHQTDAIIIPILQAAGSIPASACLEPGSDNRKTDALSTVIFDHLKTVWSGNACCLK